MFAHDLTYTALAPEHLDEVLALADRELGVGYLTFADFRSSLLDIHPDFTLVALDRRQVVGFGLGRIESPALFRERFMGREDEVAFNGLLDEGRVGLIEGVVVEEGHQGRGVGTNLVERLVWRIRRRNVSRLLALAWRSDDGVHLDTILRRQDFSPELEVDQFWRIDSLLRGYLCSTCGSPPCTCDLVVYQRAR